MKVNGFIKFHPKLIIFVVSYFAVIATLANAQGIYGDSPSVQPVDVSAGMNPNLVPSAERSGNHIVVSPRPVAPSRPGGALQPYYPPAPERRGDDVAGDANGPNDLAVYGSGTGIGGSNDNGNANTGGVQVQNVTVQSNPDVAQTAQLDADLSNSAYNGVNSARSLRIDTENAHNALILQKLENERLKSEWRRRGQIEKFGDDNEDHYHNGGDYNGAYNGPSVNIYGAAASAAAGPDANASNGVEVTAVDKVDTIEVASVGSSASTGSSIYTNYSNDKGSAFSIFPYAGKRWFHGGDTIGDVSNDYIFGVGVEGRFSDMFAGEALFTYGVDTLSCSNPYCFNQGTDSSRESYEIQANAKLGRAYGSIRPFGIVGLGYIYQSYDIDQDWVEDGMNDLGWSRSTTNIFSTIGGGIDVQVSNKFTIGARYDFQYLFDSDQYEGMKAWWGDNDNRSKATANLNIQF